jgi:hypothetical protein
MATFYSDQIVNTTPNGQGYVRRNSTSEKYGKPRSFNVTLNASGSYAPGVTPGNVTYNNGDIVVLAEIKTNDKVRSIKLLDQALTGASGLTFNVGLAAGTNAPKMPISGATNAQYGTLLNATAFASADADIQSAHTQPFELAWLNRAPGNANNFAWEDAGLSENPGGTLLIVLQLTAGTMTVAPDQVAFLCDVVND